ncbi:MAG: dipeptide epimerase, partial [Asticcacaulis sp.]|nr:dipeptide epimerase [Asticcacaulis sp.]
MLFLQREETFPIAGRFTIARGSKTEAHVLYVELADGAIVGRGESVPYARYGESLYSAMAELDAVRAQIEAGVTRDALQTLVKPGAA